MTRDEIIQIIKSIGESLVDVGRAQQSNYSQTYLRNDASIEVTTELQRAIANPMNLLASQVMTRPNAMQYILLDGFWKAYDVVIRNVDSAATAFAIRPLLELSFGNIIYFGLLNNEGQKQEIAIKYYLLTVADFYRDQLNEEFAITYKTLIGTMSQEDQEEYHVLLANNFPVRDLGLAMQKIFPSIDSSRVAKKVRPYMVGMGGQKFDHDTLRTFSARFSPYVHANPFQMSAMAKQDGDKSYLFSHSALLFHFGLQVARFTNDRLLPEPIPVDDILKRIQVAEGDLAEYSSRNFPPH